MPPCTWIAWDYKPCMPTPFLWSAKEDISHLHIKQTEKDKCLRLTRSHHLYLVVELGTTPHLIPQAPGAFLCYGSSSSLKLNAPGYQLLLYWIMWLWNLNSKICLCLKLVNWKCMDNISCIIYLCLSLLVLKWLEAKEWNG